MSGSAPVGWRSDLQGKVPAAEKPKARWRGGWEHQEACLSVLPAQDGALPNRTVPQLDKEASHATMLVVSVPVPDPGTPLHGVPVVEVTAEGAVGGGKEGDREVEGLVDDQGPLGGWEI